MRYDVFAPLMADERYPPTPFTLTHFGWRYDLLLSPPLAESILYLAEHKKSGFKKLHAFSDSRKIEQLRNAPRLLRSEANGGAAYALAEQHIEYGQEQRGAVMGAVYRTLVMSDAGTERVLDLALDGALSKDVASELFGHTTYFLYSGGFLLLLAQFYFDAEQRERVLALASGGRDHL